MIRTEELGGPIPVREAAPVQKRVRRQLHTYARTPMIIHAAPANPKYTRGGGPPVLRCLDQKIPLAKRKKNESFTN